MSSGKGLKKSGGQMKKKLAQIVIGCVLILSSIGIAYPICYGSSYYDYLVQFDTCAISFPDECPECGGWLDDYQHEAHCCRHLRGITIDAALTPPYDTVVGWSDFCDASCQIGGLDEIPNPFPLH
jgi:hypothetical protein